MILAALALVGAAPARPVFEYKGFKAGEVVAPAKIAACRNDRTSAAQAAEKVGEGQQFRNLYSAWAKAEGADQNPFPDMTSCGDEEPVIAGVKALSETILLRQDKLSSVNVSFAMTGFKTVTAAFTAKYGKPCAVSVKEVQNRMGASFPSPHYEWCFARGRLVADMYYLDLETSAAAWEDPQNQPPAGKPKVDF